MSFALDSLIGIASLLAVTYALGKWADEVFHPTLRDNYASYILGLDLTRDKSEGFHSLLCNVLNNVFGPSMVSIRALAGSAAMTAIGSAVVLSLTVAVMQARSPEAPALKQLTQPFGWLLATGTLIACSLIVDYLSLVKSLAIINSKEFQKSPFRHYIVDLAISSLISLGWVSILVGGLFLSGAFTSDQRTLTHGMEPMVYSVLSFFTALLPTLFTMAFFFAVIVAKLLLACSRPIRVLTSRVFDVERRPFSSTIALAWFVAIPAYLLYRVAA